ncbi:MAG: DUF2723 domain-containing protein, partial [Verrucomicrobia bacterium]|nr:DUF2723 domain-containing protein [Verrucomicrobiota bacterium]
MKFEKIARKSNPYLGPVLFVVALVLYSVSLCRGPFPGESASLIVQHTGLDPFMPLSHPLWGMAARTIDSLPFGSLVLNLNAFSALCAAGCVWLMYLLVSWIPHNKTSEEQRSQGVSPTVTQTVSGFVAALYLMISACFWLAATRAHTMPFDLLIVLAAACFLYSYVRSKQHFKLVLVSLLCGLGCVEFPTMLLLTPLFAVPMALMLWREERFNVKTVAGLTAVFLAGISICFVTAWAFTKTDAYEWRAFHGYWHVLRIFWRDQYFLSAKALPKVGWILLMLVSVAPWLVVAVFPKKVSGHSGSQAGSYLLHGMLLILSGMILFNFRISPWAMSKWNPLVVTPYLFIAIWTGYIVGYWYLIFTRKPLINPRYFVKVRGVLIGAYVPLVVLIMIIGGIFNFAIADGRGSRNMARFCDSVIESMGDRDWLVSDGVFDDVLLLAAREEGRSIHVLSPLRARSSGYLRYVSTLF